MAVGVSVNTPNGLLRKVTSVSQSAGQVVVQTTAARLEDAIQQGSVSLSQTLTPGAVRSAALRQGVLLARSPQAAQQGNFYLQLNNVDLGAGITANGSIDLAPSFDFGLAIQNRQLKTLHFTTTQHETANLTLTTQLAGVGIQVKKTIATFNFTPYVVMVGLVPIVVVPTLNVYVGADGSVQVGVSTGVTQDASLTGGVQYANGTWSPVQQFSNTFGYTPPTLSTGLSFDGYAEGDLVIALDDIAGPDAGLKLYLQLDANPGQAPWWQLYGGAKVDAGVEVQVLSYVVAGYHATVIDYKKVIAQAAPLVSWSWSPAASMSTARTSHTATRLPSGQVLVAGGTNGTVLATAELYNPTSNSWSSAASMSIARYGHIAVLLSSGKVLVAGDCSQTAELYDPTSNSWSPAGNMSARHGEPVSALLPSGKVLVAGGWDCSGSNAGLATAELYDPTTNTWSQAGSMSVRRGDFTATVLSSGKVLVVGGWSLDGWTGLSSVEIYDPISNSWSLAASMSTPRESHSATLLPSGKVLVAGSGTTIHPTLASAEIYDPITNTWASAGAMNAARAYHEAILLPSGQVIVVGGNSGSYCSTVLASAESYDPVTNAWSSAGSMSNARSLSAITMLSSGKVLVAGGRGFSSSLSSADLYGP